MGRHLQARRGESGDAGTRPRTVPWSVTMLGSVGDTAARPTRRSGSGCVVSSYNGPTGGDWPLPRPFLSVVPVGCLAVTAQPSTADGKLIEGPHGLGLLD